MIYLDHHATTPCDPRALEAMLPFFCEYFGNASSAHESGTQAAHAVENAREQVASLLNAQSTEIVWTSGATEANNIALLGSARGAPVDLAPERRRIVTTAVEHKSVLEPIRVLQQEGFEVVVLPVEADGCVNLDSAREVINDQTLLISIQVANGEIGTIQPVTRIAALAHERGALVHCDAAQAVGKIPVDVRALDVDILSLSAHKIYGPKGAGALFVRRGLIPKLAPLHYGGNQERGLRPGTLPVPLLVGMGEACHLCENEMQNESVRLSKLRDTLEDHLCVNWPNASRNGALFNRLPHNSSLTFPGMSAEVLLANLPTMALSTGAACDSGAPEPSKTLQAIGLSRTDAESTVRVGLGRFTSAEDIKNAAKSIISSIHTLKHPSIEQLTSEHNGKC